MDISTSSLRTATADLNGVMRGTRRPASAAARIEYEGERLPLSALALDLWGREVTTLPMATTLGGPDGQLRVTDRGPVRMPWLDLEATLVPMAMFGDDGAPCALCPRHALKRMLARYARRGWSLDIGAEIDVTLVAVDRHALVPAPAPGQAAEAVFAATCGLDALDGFGAFFDALQEGAAAMDIALAAIVSEPGRAQFALSLNPASALRTADDLWLLKSLVRGMARRHGLLATFLAKPLADEPGNGMRLRVAIRDGNGSNLFDNGLLAGSDTMRQAVAGCISAMPGSMLAFAPHLNSYARTAPRSNAPTGAAWGYENRSCAIRIPGGPAENRVIEHRIAGADANPYLVTTAVAGAALMGIEEALSPPEPVIGAAQRQRILQLPTAWADAIARFENAPKASGFFPEPLREALLAIKRQEADHAASLTEEALLWQTHALV